MSTDFAKLLADVAFLAGSVIAVIEKKFATALVAAGLFLLALAASIAK
jgi:hypothetical protein